MSIIAGVDGCRGGWFFARQDEKAGRIDSGVCNNFSDLLQELSGTEVIGIDIPIGLLERGARSCDVHTRTLLGAGRGSSVFPAPIRAVLGAVDYRDACLIRFEIEGKRMSQQAWHIVKKIKEVDDVLSSNPALQQKVYEVHPETSFFLMNGGAGLKNNKKKIPGRLERLALLKIHFADSAARALQERDRSACQADDVLDAFAALWSAKRILNGQARLIPSIEMLDGHGLRMQIRG